MITQITDNELAMQATIERLERDLVAADIRIENDALEIAEMAAENKVLRDALGAMLTHMGMDEDEWNKPTFDQARAALTRKQS
jgi:IMP cyclohydrolase